MRGRTGLSRRALLVTTLGLAGTAVGGVVGACRTDRRGPGETPAGEGAAAPGGVPNRPVTLTYLNWFGPNDPQAAVLFPHALAVFRARYPQVNIESIVASGSIMEKFLALAAAGTTPDVVALNPQFVEPLRARGALADLTPYVKRDAATFQPEDFAEATLLRAIRSGRWYVIPLQMGLWFMLYNVSVFEAAGVGKPDASWTWDRLREAVWLVKGRAPEVVGMTMPPYELPVRANGGDILSPDEKRCVLDQPPAVEAIQWNADLRLKHRVVPMPEETAGQTTRQLFDTGRLAVHIGDPGFLSVTQRGQLSFRWDIATVPRGRVRHVSTVKGPSLAIAAESKEKETAWAWLAHYTGVEMQRYVAVEGKIVSARKSALKAFVELDEGYNKQALLDTAAIALPMPYIARYDEMDKEIQAGLDAVYSGTQTARVAMAEVARKVNEILASLA
jgi:multiple sugar transport system substrate-binding protein